MIDELLESVGGIVGRELSAVSTGNWTSVLDGNDGDGGFPQKIGMRTTIG